MDIKTRFNIGDRVWFCKQREDAVRCDCGFSHSRFTGWVALSGRVTDIGISVGISKYVEIEYQFKTGRGKHDWDYAIECDTFATEAEAQAAIERLTTKEATP